MILLKPIKSITLLLMLFLSVSVWSQQVVTLKMCHDSAVVNFPLVQQKAKLLEINELKLKNLNTHYLPALKLNAKVTFQSDVPGFPEIPIPNLTMPETPKDQYAATLDISQIIYDGGVLKAAKNLTELGSKIELQKIEVDIYKVKEQLNRLYLATLVLQENQKILNLTQQTILEHRKTVASAVNNGIVLDSELDDLDAELLKLDQQIIELNSQKEQMLFAMAELSGLKISDETELELPGINNLINNSFSRPEHQLFVDQSNLLEANIQAAGKKRMPTAAAFGTLGYGNPGINMFNSEWDSYYIVGAQVSWKIWDWKQTHREKQYLSVQKQMILDQENAFNQNLTISINDAQVKQQKLAKLIEKDKEIIKLREKITNRTALQLENGTKTSADYIRDLNNEKQARLNLKLREIQNIQAKIDKLSLAGKPLFTDL